MTEKSEVLPLFPLAVVLFPGELLPLNIFKPRYKQMVEWCRETGRGFVVVLAGEDAHATVGCAAEIVKLIREYSDGRLDLLAAGRQRVRVLQTFDDLAYLQGRLEALEDTPEMEEPAAAGKLIELFRRVYELAEGGAAPALEAEAQSTLAYRIAAQLSLALSFKQELLETVSEHERRHKLWHHLEQMAERLQRDQRRKTKAGGNGRLR